MRLFTLRICAAISLVVGAISLHAADTSTAPKTKISICVPYFREEFLSLAVMDAADHGFFADNGLDVTLVPVKNTPNPNRKADLKAGEIPVNLLNDLNVAQTISEHPETCQFGTSSIERFLTLDDTARDHTVPLLLSSYGEDYDTHLVVAAGSKIKSVRDLKGKRVRLGQAPVRMAMEKILADAGMTLADIQQDYHTPAVDVLAKLQSGELAAAVTYVPTMPYMMATGKIRVLKSNIVKNYLGTSIPHSLVIANRQVSPDIARKVIRAVEQATEHLRRNPSEAIYALERHAPMLVNEKWSIDKVTAEKAGEFVGKINTENLFDAVSEQARANTLNELKAYGQMLKGHGLTAQVVDLSNWLSARGNSKVSAL